VRSSSDGPAKLNLAEAWTLSPTVCYVAELPDAGALCSLCRRVIGTLGATVLSLVSTPLLILAAVAIKPSSTRECREDADCRAHWDRGDIESLSGGEDCGIR
jgi:hypothetical protein